jgi:predicted amidohydrolase
MVTTSSARALKLATAGRLVVGGAADLMVIPPPRGAAKDVAEALLAAERRDLRLVMIGGQPMVASPLLKAVFQARRSRPRPIRVDGVERLGTARLVAAIERCPLSEPGVETA